MTEDRARKKAVRARMARTGEKYTEARRALEGAAGGSASEPERADDLASRGQFRRFTDRARRVVVLAQEESRGLRHDFVGTEHILLGLLREEEGIEARVLRSLDITVERVHAEVVRSAGLGEGVVSGQLPFTPGAKEALELALREALLLGHQYIGTEHVLLGLAREDHEGLAARILLDLGADAETLRNEVNRLSAARAGSPERSEPGRLTAQEEVDLAKRIERGDPEAKKKMVERNLHLVVSIANEFLGEGLSLEEMKRAGTRGLVRATDTFDYRRGSRFSSYATRRIRQAIVRALTERSG